MAFPARLLANQGLCGQARKKPPTTALSRGGRTWGLALGTGKEGSQAHAASSAGCASKPRPASPSFVQQQCAVRVGQHHHGSWGDFSSSFFMSPISFHQKQCSQLRGYYEQERDASSASCLFPASTGWINSCFENKHAQQPLYKTPGHVHFFPHGIVHVHFDCAFRSRCPDPTCRQAARFAESICTCQADFWGVPSHALAG